MKAHRSRWWGLVVIALAIGAGRAHAQAAPRSVYRVAPVVDIPVTAAASLAVLIPYALSRQLIDPRCPCDRDEVNAFDRRAIGNRNVALGRLSDFTVAGTVLVPAILDVIDLGYSRPLFEDALVFAEAIAINGALNTAVKFSVQRPLPRTYAGDLDLVEGHGGYRSFYSGHTSMAFSALSAAAMTLHLRHGQHVWPWLVTAAVGSSVAIERVLDGRHFASDVIVGAVVGTAVGALVPWLHVRRATSDGQISVSALRSGVWLGWVGRL